MGFGVKFEDLGIKIIVIIDNSCKVFKMCWVFKY